MLVSKLLSWTFLMAHCTETGSISVAVKHHPLSLAHNNGYMQDAPVPGITKTVKLHI